MGYIEHHPLLFLGRALCSQETNQSLPRYVKTTNINDYYCAYEIFLVDTESC